MALTAALRAWDAPSASSEGLRRYSELSQALGVARTYLFPRDVSSSRSSSRPVETPEVQRAFHVAVCNDRGPELYQDFIDAVESRFHLVKREMQRYMNRLQETSAVSIVPQTEQCMAEILDRLALWQRVWGSPLKAFNDPKLIPSFTSTFHQLLHSSFPATFPVHLRSFLLSSLARLPNSSAAHGAPRKASAPSPHLSRLSILPRYSATLTRVALEEIDAIAKEEAAKGWDARRLSRARQRVGDGVAGWLGGMFEGNEPAQQALRPMFGRFDYYLCKCFFDIRSDELFDIIVDYPDSMAALEDLKECLFKVDQRSQLVDKLKAANLKRLLHPGAETKDVITQYIFTIRCLRILDPPGVLLHKIAEPIRRHLRDREDTIKCIVSTLVEEELQDENELNAGMGIMGANGEGEGVEDFTDPKWEPEPIDAAPEFRSGKASDIISTLVSIYETREVIIKELQVLLATRLLAVKDYDAVREVRTIELLKIRFGDAALQVCDVMLKDIADSKRIDGHVQGDIESTVHPLVISRMFWPNIQSSSLHLPRKLQQAQIDYEAAFHRFKPDKHLRWLQHLGRVHVKLELSDRVVEAEATPIQASVGELFGEKAIWSLGDLTERLGVGEDVVQNAVAWWLGLGVLRKEGKGRWELLENAEGSPDVPVVYEEAPAVESVSQSHAEHIRVYWPRIHAALLNLGPQSLDAIYRMLSQQTDFRQTADELQLFMAAVKREKIVEQRVDGKYVLAYR